MSWVFPRSDTNLVVQPQKVEGLDCTMYIAKTKALMICTFVFAYAKSCFSHDAAHIKQLPEAI